MPHKNLYENDPKSGKNYRHWFTGLHWGAISVIHGFTELTPQWWTIEVSKHFETAATYFNTVCLICVVYWKTMWQFDVCSEPVIWNIRFKKLKAVLEKYPSLLKICSILCKWNYSYILFILWIWWVIQPWQVSWNSPHYIYFWYDRYHHTLHLWRCFRSVFLPWFVYRGSFPILSIPGAKINKEDWQKLSAKLLFNNIKSTVSEDVHVHECVCLWRKRSDFPWFASSPSTAPQMSLPLIIRHAEKRNTVGWKEDPCIYLSQWLQKDNILCFEV